MYIIELTKNKFKSMKIQNIKTLKSFSTPLCLPHHPEANEPLHSSDHLTLLPHPPETAASDA